METQRENRMEAQKRDLRKIAAITLIVAGTLWVLYGIFNYTKETSDANVGSLHISVDENRDANVPIWVGIGTMLVGGVLLVLGKKA